ncbi:SseB family protein [Streptomyces xanthophaeus]|uniref:SseB family protein n=1 Tax=Streptomyces xanthophaeus TaxID=67385 RepID=UPI00398FB59F
MTRSEETTGGTDPQPGQPLRLSDLAGPADAVKVPAVTEVKAEASVGGREAAARREFAVLLGEFRRAAVLVPLDPYGSLWTAEQGGIRWICAFSDEEALARFARAQGDAEREWEYRTVFGARLLDVMVPLLGVPAGVALDAGGEDGMLFPPVAGVVPESAVVGLGGAQ